MSTFPSRPSPNPSPRAAEASNPVDAGASNPPTAEASSPAAAEASSPATAARPGRDFLLVFAGQALSMQGDGLGGLALLWWIAAETGSVASATFLTLLSMLPTIVLGPFAGALVDRYSRRMLMMVADVVRALTAAVLAWGMFTGTLGLTLLGVIAAVSGTCRAFHRPALQAAIPQLVPAQALNRANSLFQMAEAGANLIAPALGGVLVAWLGAGNVMLINVATCVAAAITLFLASLPPLPARQEAAVLSKQGLLQEIAAGVRYLWRGQRMLFFMLCTFALVNFAITPVGPLLPFIGQQRMDVDATGTGLLMSGLPAGMIAGALLVSVIGSRLRRGAMIIWGITVCGLALAAVGLIQSVPPAFAALAVGGVAVSLVNVASAGLFQTLVPTQMQGRVFAVRSSIAQAAAPLSLALVGAVGGTVAPHLLILAGGILTAFAGLLGHAVPGLARAE